MRRDAARGARVQPERDDLRPAAEPTRRTPRRCGSSRPLIELPFAGHPNVGTALVLAGRGGRPDTMVFEELAGLVPIRFDWSGAAPLATLDAPQPLSLGETIPAAIDCGMCRRDRRRRADVRRTSRSSPGSARRSSSPRSRRRRWPGLPAMPLRCGQQRRGFQSRRSAFRCTSMPYPGPGAARACSRLFQAFPRIRPPAARNVALAALLLSRTGDDALSITIEQGVEMGRPSLLFARPAAPRMASAPPSAAAPSPCRAAPITV